MYERKRYLFPTQYNIFLEVSLMAKNKVFTRAMAEKAVKRSGNVDIPLGVERIDDFAFANAGAARINNAAAIINVDFFILLFSQIILLRKVFKYFIPVKIIFNCLGNS